MPAESIPLLEESRLIIQVGTWVLEESMRQHGKWETYAPGFIMGVNVSYIQLKENGLLKYLKARQRDHIPARGIILGPTKSCWVPNLYFLNEEFRELYRVGYGAVIDDFRTGYSPPSRLKELLASVLKINQNLVTRINRGGHEYIFLEYIIGLAHSISLEVCVRGVETLEEFETAKRAMPDFMQGYLFGKPVSASEFETRHLL